MTKNFKGGFVKGNHVFYDWCLVKKGITKEEVMFISPLKLMGLEKQYIKWMKEDITGVPGGVEDLK